MTTTHHPDWQPVHQISLDAYQRADIASGRLACDLLLSMPGVPHEYRENARCNATFYAPVLRDDLPGYRDWAIDIPLPEGWFSFNPSLVAAGDGFLLSARCANYEMPGWVIAPGDDRYRSRPAIVPLDRDGRQAGPAILLADATVGDDERDDHYVGVEDLRLIRQDHRLLASGSVARKVGAQGVRTISFGVFEIDLAQGVIGNPRWLADGRGALVEKNWMPVPGDGLRFVYSCGPTAVIEAGEHGEAGSLSLVRCAAAPPLASGFRGGTQLLASGDGWFALVHESADWEAGRRTYLHRVIRLGPDFAITHLSHPFRFHGEDLEFAAGLARAGDDLLVAFGLGDRESLVAAMPERSLLSLLRPVEVLAPSGFVGGNVPVGLAPLLRPEDRPRSQWPATWQETLDAPAFLINLDRAPDRLAPVMERIAAAGYRDVRRVRGVDGQEAEELARGWEALGNPPFARDRHFLESQPGHQGAFLSHVSVWQRMVDEGIECATIFEDDVRFHAEWDQLAPSFFSGIPPGVDVVWIGSDAQALPNPGQTALRAPVLTLVAVMVTNAGARRLLEIALGGEGGVTIIDQAIADAQRRALASGEDAAWWVAWSALDHPDPAAPPAAYGGVLRNHGLARADRGLMSGTEPIGAWPLLYRRFIEKLSVEDDGAAFACDRLLSHPDVPREVRLEVRQDLPAVSAPLPVAAPGTRYSRIAGDGDREDASEAPALGLRLGEPVLLTPSLEGCRAEFIDLPNLALRGDGERAPGIDPLMALPRVRVGSGRGRAIAACYPAGEQPAVIDVDATLFAFGLPRFAEGIPPGVLPPVPAMLGERPALLSSFSPTVVHAGEVGGAFRWHASHPAPAVLDGVTDATGLAPWEDGFIAVAREQIGEWPVRIIQRFVEFGPELRVRRMSGPFVLREQGDERCAGIAAAGDMVLLSFRSGGGNWLASVPAVEVNAMLVPVDQVMPGFVTREAGEGGGLSLAGLSKTWDTICGTALRSLAE